MKSREEIQASLEATLAKGETKLSEMKVKLDEAGDDASDEAKEAYAAVERMVDSGNQRLGELADASDEKFDQIVASSKENWDDLSDKIEGGWAAVSDKVKSFFA